MTAKAALAMALLEGRVLNVKNCFELIGLTNCSREISRMIEKPFSVTVSRTTMVGETRYGQRCTWVNYRLNASQHNLPGMEKMREYIKEHMPDPMTARTTKEKNQLTQAQLFLRH